MDNQSELTKQIRSAIEKKLVEINAFIDGELPDYIMILVANKRSKSHMEKDLSLFLGKDTADFTNWLWDLVHNLKVNTKQKSEQPKAFVEDENSKKTDEDVDVLNYDLNDQEGDLERDDDNNNVFTHTIPSEFKPSTSGAPAKVDKKLVPAQLCAKVTEDNKLIGKSENVCRVKTLKNQPRSTVTTFKHKSFPADEYDPTKPDFSGSISSVVQISQRRQNRPSVKANKLLLRAVDAATKSVLDGKSVSEFYKPTPIDVLSSKMEDVKPKKESVLHSGIDSELPFDSEVIQDQINRLLAKEGSNDSSESSLPEEILSVHSKISPIFANSFPTVIEEVERCVSPHFIVTLDGVEYPSLKRKHREEEETMDVDEDNLFLMDSDELPVKRQRVTERCKYWPACKNIDSCTYHHPAVPCKLFPECKFGDKCLYIHPNCKFDALCSRKDCPFTHISKRKFRRNGSNFADEGASANSSGTKVVCKFHPKCASRNCPFIHPKFCRYGSNCRMPGCQYTHFNIPSRNQMKWKADV